MKNIVVRSPLTMVDGPWQVANFSIVKSKIHNLESRILSYLSVNSNTSHMYSKYWLIIKDDSKKTFEVCGQASNDNAFHNNTYAMQKVGMNVSCVVPPVTNKTSNKDLIKVTGYTKEDGLHARLSRQYREITMKFSADNNFDNE